MQIIYIKWEDAFDLVGWRALEDVDEMLIDGAWVETVGYLVKETDTHVVVSSSIQKYRMLGPLCIPRKYVTEIRILSQAEEENEDGN